MAGRVELECGDDKRSFEMMIIEAPSFIIAVARAHQMAKW